MHQTETLFARRHRNLTLTKTMMLPFWCQLLQLNLPEVSTYEFNLRLYSMLEATSFDTVLLLAVQEVEEEDLTLTLTLTVTLNRNLNLTLILS